MLILYFIDNWLENGWIFILSQNLNIYTMKNYFFYCFFLILTSCWNTTSNSLIEIDDIDYSFTDKEFANVERNPKYFVE